MDSVNNDEKLTPAVIIAVIVIMAMAVIEFISNYKYCDNHLNFLNHDYCKYLMSSTEEGSIYMTEGGDNQVFGSLYFNYAEKLRPDLTPYDQKGNIFKKIYGDMRYISDAETLPRRMNLVDSHLFESEEPFYDNPRSSADPYFIPYWQGKRPVYLLWQRPDPWQLGDYYYKRYGTFMYKVQDIAYSLVDYLESKGSISIKEAQDQLSAWLHKTVDIGYTLDKIGAMEKEGFLRTGGGMVYFVKTYPNPHDGDYFSNYLQRWHQTSNAMYWDYLSREIIVTYDYTMGEIYRDKISGLQEARSNETNPEIRAGIDKKITENWQIAKNYYNDALVYGGDFNSTLHNVAVVYMRNGVENMDEPARELLTKALTLYQNQWGTYYIMLTFLVIDSFKNSAHEEENLKEADKWFAQLEGEANHYRSDKTRGDIIKNFEGLKKFYESLSATHTAVLDQAVTSLTNQLAKDPSGIDPGQAENVVEILYSRGLPFQYTPYIKLADDIFNRMIVLKSGDYAFINRAFTLAFQTQRLDKAYNLGKDLEAHTQSANDFSFNYYMGIVCYYLHRNNDTVHYLNRFNDLAGVSRENMMKAQDSGMIKNATDILNELKAGEKLK
jgi:hypothetical protein